MRYLRVDGFPTEHERVILKTTDLWSENPVSIISKSQTVRPYDKTRSKVCPSLWVGPVTDCTRLNESIRFKNSLASPFEGQQIWILKSPSITSLSYFIIIPPKNPVNSEIKFLFTFGGLYTNTHSTGFRESICINCTSQLEKVSVLMLRQSNFFLKTEARPPPRPAVRGELKKITIWWYQLCKRAKVSNLNPSLS